MFLAIEYYIQHFVLLPPANEVWGKVIFSVACVKNSVHRRGEYLGRYTPCGQVQPRGQVHPPRQVHPPWAGISPRQVHPPGQVHPREQCMLGDTGNKRAVRILLECILVYKIFSEEKKHTNMKMWGIVHFHGPISEKGWRLLTEAPGPLLMCFFPKCKILQRHCK